MRYLDELLTLYPGKDALTQRFVLTQVLGAEPDDSAGDAIDLLRRELASSEPRVGRAARHVLGATLARHVQVTYALTVPKPTEDLLGLQSAAALAAAAAPYLVEPLRRVFARLASPRPEVAWSASLVLGRLWTQGLTERVTVLARDETSLPAVASLAEIGSGPARAAVLELLRTRGPQAPDLFLSTAGLPPAEALSVLADAEARTDAYGRSCLALALAHFPGDQVRPQLERLIRRREGWVTAYALDTLAGSGTPADFPLVKLAYEEESHEFLRVQALRAAGAIGTGDARELCLTALAKGSGRLQAVALEALAQMDVPPAELARLARPLVESDFVRCRVQAVLCCAREEPGLAESALGFLILASEPLLRLEGAYLLGYLRGPGSAELLTGLACEDPSPFVRRQAIRSLGRHGAEESVARLAPLLDTADPIMVTEVARALIAGAGRGTAARLLGAAVPRSPTAAARGALLTELGTACAPAAAVPDLVLAALASTDPAEQLGALDGVVAGGGATPVDLLAPLTESPHPRVRARACLAAFLAGDLDRIAMLAEPLAIEDGDAGPAAMGALLDLGLLLPLAGTSRRWRGMVDGLTPGARTPRADVSQVGIKLDGLYRPGPVRRKTGLAPALTAPLPADRPLDQAGLASLRVAYRKTATRLAALPQPAPGGRLAALFAGLARLRATGVMALPKVFDLSAQIELNEGWLAWKKGALAAGVLAIAGLALLAWPAAPAPDAPFKGDAKESLTRTLLRVAPGAARATVRSGRQSDPAVAGSPLAAGDEISTGAGGSATLTDVAGDVVRLGGDASLTVGQAVRGSTRFRVDYQLKRLAGRLDLDFHAQPQVELSVGQVSLALHFARVDVMIVDGRVTGSVISGTAEVSQPGKPLRKLAAGSAIDL